METLRWSCLGWTITGESCLEGESKRRSNVLISREEGVILRDIRLKGLSGEFSLVKHIQFTDWSNYGVVEEVEDLVGLVRRVEREWGELEGPLVVYCEGGLGRTGTFTTVLSLYLALRTAVLTSNMSTMENHLGKEEDLMLTGLVMELRRVRHPWMVEGIHQYLLAYRALLQLLRRILSD